MTSERTVSPSPQTRPSLTLPAFLKLSRGRRLSASGLSLGGPVRGETVGIHLATPETAAAYRSGTRPIGHDARQIRKRGCRRLPYRGCHAGLPGMRYRSFRRRQMRWRSPPLWSFTERGFDRLVVGDLHRGARTREFGPIILTLTGGELSHPAVECRLGPIVEEVHEFPPVGDRANNQSVRSSHSHPRTLFRVAGEPECRALGSCLGEPNRLNRCSPIARRRLHGVRARGRSASTLFRNNSWLGFGTAARQGGGGSDSGPQPWPALGCRYSSGCRALACSTT